MVRAVSALLTTIAGVGLLVAYKPTPEDLAAPQPSTSAPAGLPRPTAAPPSASARPSPTPVLAGGHRDVAGPVVDTRFGPVQVSVTLDGGHISDVKALQLPTDRARSAFISQYAGPRLRAEAVQAQNADIDIISGATYTSVAYARSLSSALSRAGQ